MEFILPPKRYQNPEDPKFDCLRHKPFYWKLVRRREKLPILRAAHTYWIISGKTQKEVGAEYKISTRELQDFIQYQRGESRADRAAENTRKTYQAIIDSAYYEYNQKAASVGFERLIEIHAELYGQKASVLSELWCVDPLFYPSNYKFK